MDSSRWTRRGHKLVKASEVAEGDIAIMMDWSAV